MKRVRLLAILSILFFTATALYSSWQLDEFPFMCEEIEVNPEQDASFINLKNKVKQSLKGTWCSEEKADLLMDLTYITRPQVCVEIGAFTGSSILPVAATLHYIGEGKIYAIDAWSNEETIRYLEPNDPNRIWWATVDMKAVRRSFDALIKTWKLENVCSPLAKTSALAYEEIPEIDFLHIDGDFSEQGSLYDTQQYLKKVKQGGYVLLSNIYHTVNNRQPKLKAFSLMFDTCEFITDIDRENCVLFRKL